MARELFPFFSAFGRSNNVTFVEWQVSSITFGASNKPSVWKEDGGVLKLTSTGFAYNLPKLFIKLFNIDRAVSLYVNDVV